MWSVRVLEFGGAPFLKGEDMIIYRGCVAKSLGLSVQLKAICRGFDNGDFIVPSFQHKVDGYINEESNDEAMLAEVFGSVES